MGTVYILGAGASCFAGFPLASCLRCFLEQEVEETEVLTKQHGRKALRVIDTVVSSLQAQRLCMEPSDLEVVFTYLDLAATQGGIIGNLTNDDLQDARYGFAQLISWTFKWHAYLVQNQIFGETNCGLPLDRRRVRDVVNAWVNRVSLGDTIVTFNWDPLHEIILWNAQKWHYQDGYGFLVKYQVQAALSSVRILKLHGSCNWALRHLHDRHPSVEHIAELFPGSPNSDTNLPLGSTSDHGESLILPSYFKDPGQKPALLTVWEQAEDALRHASKLVVLGYSLPLADVPTRTMLSLALQQNKNLEAIQAVLGTDHAAYARWDDFSIPVGKHVQPICQTFEDFVLGN